MLFRGSESIQLIEIKRDTAPKTGLRADGGITYAVVRDLDSDTLFFTLIANNGGSYHSKELVPVSRIEACLSGFEAGKVVPTKALRDAFTWRLYNNAGFLAACATRGCCRLSQMPLTSTNWAMM